MLQEKAPNCGPSPNHLWKIMLDQARPPLVSETDDTRKEVRHLHSAV